MLVVPRGLQNRCGGLGTSQVGSIPTYSRQKAAAEVCGGFLMHIINNMSGFFVDKSIIFH